MTVLGQVCRVCVVASWPYVAWSADAVEDALSAFREGNMQHAVALLSEAAHQGDMTAAANLGVLLARGQGTAQNDAEALYWLWKARLMGESRAGHMADAVARCMSAEPRDEVLDRLARDLEAMVQDGSIRVLLALGALESALRRPADTGQAYMWFAAAAALGNTEALILRDKMALGLSASERQAAQEKLSKIYNILVVEAD